MKTKTVPVKMFLFYLAMILTNIVVMQDMVIYPIISTLYGVFPTNTAGVNLIISAPAIIMVVTSMLVPYLLKYISRKHLLAFACLVFTFASIFGSAIVAIPYMLTCRILCGFAYGTVQVTVIDLIACHFTDENKRASFMGIYNTCMSALGIIMSLTAGNLAVSGWQNVYKTYLLAIPMTVLVLFFVPNNKAEIPAETSQTADSSSDSGNKTPIGRRFWLLLLNYCFFAIAYGGCFSMLVSLYVSEHHLGNEAFVGMLTSVTTLGSVIFCMLFGFLFSKFKARTSLLHYLVMILAIAIMAFHPDKTLLILTEFLGGAVYGMQFSYMYSQGTSIVPAQKISKAISYITAATGLAMFITPNIFTGIMGITGSFTSVLPIVMLVLTICLIIEFINTGKMQA